MRRVRVTKERLYSEERKNIRKHKRETRQLKSMEKQKGVREK
jgi:hypothetical protein